MGESVERKDSVWTIRVQLVVCEQLVAYGAAINVIKGIHGVLKLPSSVYDTVRIRCDVKLYNRWRTAQSQKRSKRLQQA